ncbi:DUF1566 domain-containing protein, partial [bacterium]|nr:DUF1566 domain-containing protein [bacterium]
PPSILEDWTQSTSGHKQIGGSHDIQWIDPGLMGEGNFLVFNNGQYLSERTPQSYVFEINGFLDAKGNDTGNYVNPPDAGYYILESPKDTHKAKKQMSNQIVWLYASKSNQGFFSHIGSGAQRLPNDNTLICADTEGHLFEVTSEGELVWEYINPVTKDGILEVMPDNIPMTNAIFRAYRYGPDHPALAGRDLTPKDTITGSPPAYLTPQGTIPSTELTNAPSTITGTTHVPAAPTATDSVWVTARVTDDGRVSGVTLTYDTDGGNGSPMENIVFMETMRNEAVKPWTGDGCDNAWTVIASTNEHVEQRTQANYGDGNPCGLEFGTGTNDETQTMIETTNGIDARGTSGYVEFWVWADGLEGTDGWTFQLDSRSGYATRLSELTGSNHDWQQYHFDLLNTELVSDLKMRFQFRGGDQGDRVRLDFITVNVTSGNGEAPSRQNVTMYDDGVHEDGRAGDDIFGGQIPTFPEGTTVNYYITARDDKGSKSTDPVAAPSDMYSYSVAPKSDSWTTLKIPDTGQTGDYTSTFGEDSDYTINPPSYTDNGDGTVTDNVTGLMWQQEDSSEMTWEKALAYSGNLSLAGYDDWRFPSSHELFSIVDHGAVNPALNTDYFLDSGAEYWWSITERAGDSSRAWVVNAGGGIGAHPKSETISAGGTKRFHVRCVRGGTNDGAEPRPDFIDNGDGTVTDKNTELMWQQAEIGTTMTWEEGLTYCENLSLAGYDDWRLPNIKELRSMSNDKLSKPSIDITYFPGIGASRYWSSTTEANHTTRAWTVNFEYGLVSYEEKSSNLNVLCVRGGTTTPQPTPIPGFVQIPGGEFEMGDHHDLGSAEHTSDEVPIHTVRVDSFYIGTTEVTNQQYCDYLNSALSQGLIEVRGSLVYAVGGSDIYCETREAVPYSRIGW